VCGGGGGMTFGHCHVHCFTAVASYCCAAYFENSAVGLVQQLAMTYIQRCQ
jgi:hypothetical protein